VVKIDQPDFKTRCEICSTCGQKLLTWVDRVVMFRCKGTNHGNPFNIGQQKATERHRHEVFNVVETQSRESEARKTFGYGSPATLTP